MSLETELAEKRQSIHTDSYPISINELVSMYKARELDIHPEFQRFFRWSDKQKSDLIESILLGIPLPSIFVYQRDDGVLDVIDGIQRISTILQFLGELKTREGGAVAPLTLQKAYHLPSLDGKVWDKWIDSILDENVFSEEQKRFFKRAKVDVKLILRESDKNAKYDLFQRLNTGGSLLSDQEVRNCLLIMINEEMFKWLRGLADFADFQNCLALSERQLSEQFDMELALRFLIFRNLDPSALINIGELGEFLTNRMKEIAEDASYPRDREALIFKAVFAKLNETLQSDSFRKYDARRGRFIGGFSVSAYEIIGIGLGFNYGHAPAGAEFPDLLRAVQSVWEDPRIEGIGGSGIRASTRLPRTIPLGRELFRF